VGIGEGWGQVNSGRKGCITCYLEENANPTISL
jgi:hypothetical protein